MPRDLTAVTARAVRLAQLGGACYLYFRPDGDVTVMHDRDRVPSGFTPVCDSPIPVGDRSHIATWIDARIRATTLQNRSTP